MSNKNKKENIIIHGNLLPYHFALEVTQSGGGDSFSAWVSFRLIDADKERLQSILYTISPVIAGQGRVEITTEPPDRVRENPADLQITNWPGGNTTTSITDDSKPVTAFRLAVVSGTMRLTARGI